MIHRKNITLSLVLLLSFSVLGFGQFCADFHKTGDCRKDLIPNFRCYSQSRSDLIKVGFTIKYDIVFYGEQEYMVSFCTMKNFYPVHFKLIDGMTGEAFYDNKEDDYLESIGFAVEKTRRILVEVEILAHKASDEEIEEYYPCIGMLIQFREYKE
jgi:hypothetical protein